MEPNRTASPSCNKAPFFKDFSYQRRRGRSREDPTPLRQRLHVNLRTVLGYICNSSTLLRFRRQPLEIAIHPGGSSCCTWATATPRGAAAAQNSDWSPLIALTTWTTFENAFFMSVVPFDARQGKQSGSKLADECLFITTYRAQRQSSVIPVTNFVFNAAWQKLRLSAGPPLDGTGDRIGQ